MTTLAPRFASVLAAGLLALAATGCGVELADDAGGAPTPVAEGPDDTTPVTVGPDETEPAPEETETEPASESESETDSESETESESEFESETEVPGFDEDALKDQLVTGFQSLGLDEQQASCLADAYLDEFGTDSTATPDVDVMFDLFDECGIDPTTIGGGG